MFEIVTPESIGIKSSVIKKFITLLDKRGARTHSFIMLRHGKIFAEGYYKPFDKDFCHRMYSQTKSFVGIAICLLKQDGLLDFNDKIHKFFPDRIPNGLDKYSLDLTVEDMLTMSTFWGGGNWFANKIYDRTNFYFTNTDDKRPIGALWEYDSAGSQVLCSLVERLSGMSLLDYLKLKLFDKTGFFKTAKVLKTPNGDSWGDSAMVCTQRDIASFGQLLLDNGCFNGEQLIDKDLVKQATSKIVDNRENSFTASLRKGYGYQIWKIADDGFAFIGMGDQLTFCLPSKDVVFSICSDNQGNGVVRELIHDYFFDLIIDEMVDYSLPEDEISYNDLTSYLNSKELFSMQNSVKDNIKDDINGVKYNLEDNPMGIKWFKFVFTNDEGEFIYENAQGQKIIKFGIDKNVFDKFPQFGYAKDYGTQVTTDGFMYKSASSLAFVQKNRLILCVQIIDDYFGNLSAVFGFNGDEVAVSMSKTAEDFLNEYQGKAVGKRA